MKLLIEIIDGLYIGGWLPDAAIGEHYSAQLTAHGNTGPVRWSITSGAFPDDVDIDPVTGTISGGPLTTAGSFEVTVRLDDNAGNWTEQRFAFRVQALPVTITGSLSEWTVGVPAVDELTISGGSGVYVSAGIAAGALPAGMGLSIVGNTLRVSGTPTVESSGSVTVFVVDSGNAEATIVLLWEAVENTDPDWHKVAALLHFDGAQGSTSIIDQTGRVWSAHGGADLSVPARFGPTSLRLNGSSGDIYTSNTPDFNFALDFTEEAWLYLLSVKVHTIFGAYYSSPTGGIVIGIGVPGNIAATFRTSAGWEQIATPSGAISTSVWTHVAVAKSGSTVRIFVDGVKRAEGVLAGVAGRDSGIPIYLGHDATEATRRLHGHIDDFRYTSGVCRYTSDFAPPDAPFPDRGP